MELSFKTLKNYIDAIIASEYFLVACYTIFAIALIVYIYTAVVICKKGCSNNIACGLISPTACSRSCEPENWLIATQIQQTPINIYCKCGFYCALGPLKWNNHDSLPCGIVIKNTGRTVVMQSVYMCKKPKVCGASLPNSYSFVQISFVWSQKPDCNVGHMLNGHPFSLEMHVMYYNGSREKALCACQMLIIAYLFKIGGTSKKLEPITKHLKYVRNCGTKYKLPAFPLSTVVPVSPGGFFCYIGTTHDPPFAKGVKWLVYAQPLTVSQMQLCEFFKLLNPDKEPIQHEGRRACNVKP